METRTWFALLAPPIAWFTALNAGYFMVSWACGSEKGLLAMHLVLLGTLGIAIGAGLTARGEWRKSGSEWPGESGAPLERRRFLSVLGLMGAVLFSLLILAQWLAAVILGPCEAGPRLPFSPSAMQDATLLHGAITNSLFGIVPATPRRSCLKRRKAPA